MIIKVIVKTVDVLDEILGNVIKIRILRHLAAGFEAKTGRALAVIADVSQPAVLKPLQELVEQGILTMSVVGRSHSYNLNKKNILVAQGLVPLFQLEANLLPEFGKILCKSFPSGIDSAILYGSIARGGATYQSDWDVLILCHNRKVAKRILQRLSKDVPEWAMQFSSSLDIKVMTTHDYRKKFAARDALARSIYQDYINSRSQNPLFGRSLTEILRGQNGKKGSNKTG